MGYDNKEEKATDSHGLNTEKLSLRYEDIIETFGGPAFEGYNIFSYGCSEKVYQRALELHNYAKAIQPKSNIKIRVSSVSIRGNM